MLKLLVYAPCEKAIIADDKTSSIVSIMESVTVRVAKDVPADALAPIRWTVYSLWKRDQLLEQSVDMEEQTRILRPDDTVAAGGTSRFTVSNEHLFYRSLVNLPVFPIGLPGFVKVQCRIRQANPETEWADIAEFPLLVIHEQAPETIAPDDAPKKPEETA
jgi:hypothetical protein